MAGVQGVLPERAHLVLGDGTEVGFRVQDYAHYYRNVRDRFLQHIEVRPETYPEPVEACALCHWRERCAAQWEADDHLSRVAGIRKVGARPGRGARGVLLRGDLRYRCKKGVNCC